MNLSRRLKENWKVRETSLQIWPLDFLASKGCSTETFVGLCQEVRLSVVKYSQLTLTQAIDAGDAGTAAFIDILVESLDFETFILYALSEEKRQYFKSIMRGYAEHLKEVKVGIMKKWSSVHPPDLIE